MSYMNGQMPDSALSSIPGGRLRRDAAAAWNAMVAAHGPIEVTDSYRILGAPGDLQRGRWSQWFAWERYQHGGNLAARPGTSNHGWGLAIDTNDHDKVNHVGAGYGWQKRWSDAPSENWHFRYRTAIWHATLEPLRRGSFGPRVRIFSSNLAKLGFRSRGCWRFGPGLEANTRRFQLQHALRIDGIAGPQTLGLAANLAKGKKA